MTQKPEVSESKRDLHKRLSQMEIEINELNDLLTENIDSSQKKRLTSNAQTTSSDALTALEESILNDKIDFMKEESISDKEDDSNKQDSKKTFDDDSMKIFEENTQKPLDQDTKRISEEDKKHSSGFKANSDWVVYTNQEGRRIHEITVKQKILDIEKNPVTSSETFESDFSESHKKKRQKEHLNIEEEKDKTEEKERSEEKEKSESSVSGDRLDYEINDRKEHNTVEIKSTNSTENVSQTTPTELPQETQSLLYSNQPKKNPFRVISVTNYEQLPYKKQDSSSTDEFESNIKNSFVANASSPNELENIDEIRKTFEEIEIPSDIDVMLQLHDHLCKKIAKLQKEIVYVDNIVNNHYSYSLSFDELNQFKRGNRILKNYLDKKFKQKYEIELRLSSKFRKLKNEDKMNPTLFFSNR